MINCPYKMTVKQMKEKLNEFSEDDTICLYCQAAPYKAIAELLVYDRYSFDSEVLLSNQDSLKEE